MTKVIQFKKVMLLNTKETYVMKRNSQKAILGFSNYK